MRIEIMGTINSRGKLDRKINLELVAKTLLRQMFLCVEDDRPVIIEISGGTDEDVKKLEYKGVIVERTSDVPCRK